MGCSTPSIPCFASFLEVSIFLFLFFKCTQKEFVELRYDKETVILVSTITLD